MRRGIVVRLPGTFAGALAREIKDYGAEIRKDMSRQTTRLRKGIVVRNEVALRRRAKEIRSNRRMRQLTESLKMMWQPQLLRSLVEPTIFTEISNPEKFGGTIGIKCYKIPSQGGPYEQTEGEETTEQLPQ